MSFQECQLGDVADFNYGKALPERVRVPGEFPVFGSGGQVGTHRTSIVKGPGIIVGRKGTVGATYWVEDDFCPIDTTYFITAKHEETDLRYLYYLIKSLPLSDMNTDAAVPGLNRDNALRVKISFATSSEQKRIVSTLSAYDDLIKNNQRRIALLEEAARLLYREWFVHFRFPGAEHVKIVDGVPEGWEALIIDDLCTVGRGASPRPIQKFLDGEIPWFKIGDATASESAFVFETKEMVTADGSKKSVFLEAGELILSNSATCGVPNFTGVQGCIHDGWLHFKNLTRVSKNFLFLYLLQQQKALLQGIGEGATQKNLNTKYVGSQRIVIPLDPGITDVFDNYIQPIFIQIRDLAELNSKLVKARDLLLPRLMNGRLEI